MQRVPATDVVDGGHDLQFHQGTADDLVPRHVPHHADQAGHLLDRAWPPPWHDADDGLENQDQARRGDADRQREDKLDGRIEMDDAYLGGERGGAKTGRGSPGKKPIVAAVQTDEKGRPHRIKLSRIARFKRRRVKSLAKRIIAPGATVLTDGLACFRGVADAGCVHIAIATGSGRKAPRHPAFKWVNTMLGNIKSAITGTYRALRKKHIVRYLAEFEWRFNHRFDLAAMIPALARAAVAAKPAPYWWLKMADYGA
ncbi:IS1595 family transposase [Hyphomicrobium sp. B1]|uniref:IS1595 family transposase n=1 Tax=unclassified Hyphomicrobium TaxID=2619925 RepID=UPI0039C3D13A